MSTLPKPTWDCDGDAPNCPWCNAYMERATITLGALAATWFGEREERPELLSPPGDPEATAIITDCPSCGRPSMVGFREGPRGRIVELRPCRTPADVALLKARAE